MKLSLNMERSLYFLLIFSISLLSAFNTVLVFAASAPKNRTTSADRIRSHGYPAEIHKVETPDGYILTLFRIPHSPKTLNQDQRPRPAILLHHGLRSSSDVYLLNGPNDGLPFLLADAGYDVWLANARGNVYSRENRYRSVYSRRFWQFSWHEIGTIDLPATIDYMLNTTGQQAVHLAGHSQGGLVHVVLLSARPEYNKKVKTVHLLAPVVFVGHVRDPTINSQAWQFGLPGPASDQFRDREFAPDNPYLKIIVGANCNSSADGSSSAGCLDFIGTYLYEDDAWLNTTVIPALRETHPAGASTTQLVHYTQLYLSNRFCLFDYGWEENLKRYGRGSPPNYELERIVAPVYVYYSDYDESCTPGDLSKLTEQLPNVRLYHRVPLLGWTHMDFILGLDVRRQVNEIIVSGLDEHEEQEKKSR